MALFNVNNGLKFKPKHTLGDGAWKSLVLPAVLKKVNPPPLFICDFIASKVNTKQHEKIKLLVSPLMLIYLGTVSKLSLILNDNV